MALPDVPLHVEVVSADGLIWEGDAVQVIARTTEGDIGILPNHEPLLAALVPSAAEITTTAGDREVVAVADGFLSVSENRVALLSGFASLAGEISLAEAERDLAAVNAEREAGANDPETVQRFHRASAQVRAAAKASGHKA